YVVDPYKDWRMAMSRFIIEFPVTSSLLEHSKNESGILTLAYNRQDIDTTGFIIHFIKYMLPK
ncbi:hypothetical protein OHF33_25440, partial [Escherichia coli]|nr:hypothetical protein [Escherichia coli]MCV3064617.1 hypothetical protein [Escherichia coli]